MRERPRERETERDTEVQQSSMSASQAASAAQAAAERAAALRAQAAASWPAAQTAASSLDEACLKLDDVLGRVGAALRAVNDQYISEAGRNVAQAAAPPGVDHVHPADAEDEEAAALAELAGLDSRLGEVQSRAGKVQEEQQRWREFFVQADAGGRGTAHRDDLLALLGSSGLSITGTVNSHSVQKLRQALASSDEGVTLHQFMAQVRVATATDGSPRATHAVSQATEPQMLQREAEAKLLVSDNNSARHMHGTIVADETTQPAASAPLSERVEDDERIGNGHVATAAPRAKLDLPSEAECDRLFESWDTHRSGGLSLAEINAAVVNRGRTSATNRR